MVTPLRPRPAGSPAAAALGASENGHYVDCAPTPSVVQAPGAGDGNPPTPLGDADSCQRVPLDAPGARSALWARMKLYLFRLFFSGDVERWRGHPARHASCSSPHMSGGKGA